jgi:glutaredoxin
MRHIAQVGILLLWSAAASAAQDAQTVYKSVGPDGRAIYSDRPPAEGRLEKTMMFENLPSSPLPASTSAYVEQLRSKAPPSSASTPGSGVVLYSAAWCGFCKSAKAYLAGKGIKYQEFDIGTKEGMAAFAYAGGGKGIPLLLANGQRVRGFTPAAYDALFASRK